MQTIKIQKSTYKRLVSHIEDFGETEDDVINRGLDKLEKPLKNLAKTQQRNKTSEGQLQFGSANLPDVTFSKPVNIKVNGKESVVNDWKGVYYHALKLAVEHGYGIPKLVRMFNLNISDIPVNDKNYDYDPNLKIWIRYIGSVNIVYKIRMIANELNLDFELVVQWPVNSKAKYSGKEARILIN